MLAIKNLSVGHGKKTVATVKDFSLNSGQHGLILGPSGSGKSTLLYTMAGLLPIMATGKQQSDTSLFIDGVNLATMAPAMIESFRGKKIGVIYQSLYLMRSLTVLENLLVVFYAAQIKNTHAKVDKQAAKKFAMELLQAVGIENLAEQKPDQLSLGQQQRVAIARAAVHQPRIIFGDEPTSALDDASCHDAMKLLLRVASDAKASLVVATHDARIKKYFDKTINL